MTKIHVTDTTLLLERADGAWLSLPDLTIDDFFRAEDPSALLDRARRLAGRPAFSARAPIGQQEVWAAGVTYFRSRTARMEESKDAGGGSFYDKVYSAERPELFFKATPHRVSGPNGYVRIRGDSRWNVPEPELTLAINRHGRIFGYTIGNDMSSRDIEGENPLYLPQAKVYQGSAALGPAILLADEPLSIDTGIRIEIRRAGAAVFSGETRLRQIKRSLPSLAEWLFRENTFPAGCFLMTGTGIVPPDAFSLQPGDEIAITVDPIGTLVNTVAA
jgi:2-dehydro-3-deoxy-D-arabinonate dehydratase